MKPLLIAGLAAGSALLAPAAASAHPSWYFATAKLAKAPEIQTLSSPSAGWRPSAGAPALGAAATAAEVQAALDADPAMVPGSPGYDNVRVTGAAGGPYTVTFVGTLAGVDVPALAATGATVATVQDGGANVTYSGDAAADQAAMADQQQAVIVNDGYTLGFRETNGLGPVYDATIQGFRGAGMLNLSKVLPGGYRAGMTELQKLEYPPAQTGIQVHATCAGVAALEAPATIARVWDRATDHDPFFNYVPWQSTSAGLGDSPAQWIPVVKAATGVDLATTGDAKAACARLGGTYHPADTSSTTASAAIADAVAPLNTQITALTAQVGSLLPQLDRLRANQASVRPLRVTLPARTLHSRGVTLMVTGPANATASVSLKVTTAVAKALHLKTGTLATAARPLGAQGAALVSLAARKSATKALRKAKGSLTATVVATSGSTSTTASAKLAD